MNELTELIKSGNTDALAAQLKSRPELANGQTEQGISLLQYAAYFRNKEAIEIILSYKSGLDVFEAVTIGELLTTQKFLMQQPSLANAISKDGFTPLALASYFGHVDIVKLLLQHQADPNTAANNQMRVAPLHSACAISNYDIAELLLSAGANVNARQHLGVTPLHSAAHNGQTKLAKLLIDHGAEVNARSDGEKTPLAMAKEKGFEETAQLIIKYGGLE